MRRAEVVADSVLSMDFGEDPKVDLVLVLEIVQDMVSTLEVQEVVRVQLMSLQ